MSLNFGAFVGVSCPMKVTKRTGGWSSSLIALSTVLLPATPNLVSLSRTKHKHHLYCLRCRTKAMSHFVGKTTFRLEECKRRTQNYWVKGKLDVISLFMQFFVRYTNVTTTVRCVSWQTHVQLDSRLIRQGCPANPQREQKETSLTNKTVKAVSRVNACVLSVRRYTETKQPLSPATVKSSLLCCNGFSVFVKFPTKLFDPWKTIVWLGTFARK